MSVGLKTQAQGKVDTRNGGSVSRIRISQIIRWYTIIGIIYTRSTNVHQRDTILREKLLQHFQREIVVEKNVVGHR